MFILEALLGRLPVFGCWHSGLAKDPWWREGSGEVDARAVCGSC